MPRYERIAPNLMGAYLPDGEIDLIPSHGWSCFFIVNVINNKAFINKTAMEFVLAGCKDFHFFGKMEPEWHIAVDQMDITISSDSAYESVALTSGYSDIEEFADVLHEITTARAFVPHDSYLLYDDKVLHEQVISMVTSSGR